MKFRLHASSAYKVAGIKALGKTGETFVNEWMKEKLFGKKKEFDSKFFEKGNFCEDGALKFSAELLGYEHSFKNDEYFEDDYFCGTPDLILENQGIIVDIKNSWDCFTFPLFEETNPNDGYYLQLQIYMHLTGIHNAELVYCLMDAPATLINKESKRQAWASGYMGFPTDEIHGHVVQKMTYSDIPDKLRIKVFKFEYDPKCIEKLQSRVKECQELIENSEIFQSFMHEKQSQSS